VAPLSLQGRPIHLAAPNTKRSSSLIYTSPCIRPPQPQNEQACATCMYSSVRILCTSTLPGEEEGDLALPAEICVIIQVCIVPDMFHFGLHHLQADLPRADIRIGQTDRPCTALLPPGRIRAIPQLLYIAFALSSQFLRPPHEHHDHHTGQNRLESPTPHPLIRLSCTDLRSSTQ
jgi:hypothetical protein